VSNTAVVQLSAVAVIAGTGLIVYQPLVQVRARVRLQLPVALVIIGMGLIVHQTQQLRHHGPARQVGLIAPRLTMGMVVAYKLRGEL
jgi:hypothetical protein